MSLVTALLNRLFNTLKFSAMRKMLLSSCFILLSYLSFSQSQNIDCENAIYICDKEKITIESLEGFGNVKDDLNGLTCNDGVFKEKNTIWFKWKVDKPGNLMFNIIPLKDGDDIDFVVFKVDDDSDACQTMENVRCMASGQNLGREEQSKCVGMTGLRNLSTDISEDQGCHGEDDNFLAPLQTEKGETYLLFINNYSSTTGFELEFTGKSNFSNEKCEIKETIEGKEHSLSIGEVFPNPTQEFINITLESPKQTEASFTIIDIYGKRITSKKEELLEGKQQTKIDVKNLSAGTYFITISTGEESVQRKFIKI